MPKQGVVQQSTYYAIFINDVTNEQTMMVCNDANSTVLW